MVLRYGGFLAPFRPTMLFTNSDKYAILMVERREAEMAKTIILTKEYVIDYFRKRFGREPIINETLDEIEMTRIGLAAYGDNFQLIHLGLQQ